MGILYQIVALRRIHHGEVFSIKTENLQAYVDQYYGCDSHIIDWRASNFLSRIDYWVYDHQNRVTHYAIIDIDNLEWTGWGDDRTPREPYVRTMVAPGYFHHWFLVDDPIDGQYAFNGTQSFNTFHGKARDLQIEVQTHQAEDELRHCPPTNPIESKDSQRFKESLAPLFTKDFKLTNIEGRLFGDEVHLSLTSPEGDLHRLELLQILSVKKEKRDRIEGTQFLDLEVTEVPWEKYDRVETRFVTTLTLQHEDYLYTIQFLVANWAK